MEYSESVRRDTTSDFLRSFSVVSEDGDFDTLSPLPQEDAADGPWKVSPEQTILPVIPFTSIHKLPVAFDSAERHCWVPRKPITVKITSYERQTHPRRLNPNLYTIEVSHHDFHWTIRRRYKHFSNLHSELRNFRRLHSIPLPSKEHRQMRMSIRDHKQQVSKFPTKLEIRISEDEIPARMKQLEDYLNTMLKCAVYRNHHETVKFFGVSHLSFVRQLGKKGYESMVKKCSGGRRINLGCCSCLKQCHLAGRWSKRWMVVKDTFVTYLDPDSGRTCDVMLMDNHFSVECGFEETGARHGVSITNLSRRLLLKCWTSRKSREWMQHLEDAAHTTGKDFTQANRHNSFAPVREDTYARWFIDGASYFAAVAEALEMAKEEIFITDWWLSPEIYLKRPVTEGDKWQLDMVLKRKAEQGVKVFVLLYKEVEFAIGLNSLYSKQKLCQHHENIKVLRHPDHVTKGVLLWAHHEKVVVIDQKIAFVSGIDLCYGRWDDDQHRLTDLGSIVPNSVPEAVTMSVVETAGSETLVAMEPQEVSEISGLDRNCNQEGVDQPDVRNTDDVKVSVVVQSPDEVEEIIHGPKIAELKTEEKNTSDSEPEETKEEREKRLKENVLSKLKNNFFSKRIHNDNKSEETLQSHIEDDVSRGASNEEGPSYDRGMSKESTMSRESALSRESAVSKESKASTDAQYRPNRPKLRLLRSKNYSKKAGAENARESCPPDMDRRRGSDEVDSRAKFRALVHAVKTSRSTKRWTKSNDQVEVPRDYFLKPTSPKAQKPPKKSLKDKVPWTGQKQDEPRPGKYTKTLDLPPDLYRTTSQQEFDKLGLLGGTKTWLGKDYVNFIFKDFENLDQPFTDFIDRTKTPRMPWHDIGSVVYGKAARDVARHFIGRWNTVKLEKAKYTAKYPFLLPKCYDDIPVPQTIKNITFATNTQILRSCGKWSAGLSHTETSILNAYISLITNAKHFIYIENQFFITPIDHPDVKNGIGKALFDRIMKAHRNGEKFRVYVVMPLLPGFEGAFGTATGTAIQAVTHWNYMSMYRGPYSLYNKLCAEGVRDPMKYISFYGLRTHSELVGELVTELVYVHCKLMIVDDLQVIIGSANVNDRSMMGNRDSEVAVLVEDKHTFEVSFADVPHRAGYFASSLRRTLFREHLGIEQGDSQVDLSDPVGDQFFKDVWVKQASVNTTAFEKVFNCIPTDTAVTFAQLHQYMKQVPMCKSNPDQARELLKKVRGHLVLIPASFLCHEDLTPQSGTKEALLPVSLWT